MVGWGEVAAQEMRFLGVDQSLTHTGICLIDHQRQVLSLFTIIPAHALRGVKRLVYIREELRKVLTRGIDLVAFEGFAYDAVMGGHQLGEIAGALKVLTEELGIPFIEVAPVALKKFATGDAKATKEAMIHEAHSAVRDDHQADAYHLAHVARMFFTGETSTKRAQLEVIQRLKQGRKKVKKRRARKIATAM